MILRPELPPMIPRIARLPLSPRGYPVPWFVSWINGEPDFRLADGRKMTAAIREGRCYVCGEKLGKFKCFPIGPMCAVNRNSGEPPSHQDCCEWSVKACPFMLRPGMVRRTAGMPESAKDAGGIMIHRNPGVMCLWTVKSYSVINVNGLLFRFGDPEKVSWWREGRPATRAEVEESVTTGLPILRELCTEPGSLEELEKYLQVAKAYWPA